MKVSAHRALLSKSSLYEQHLQRSHISTTADNEINKTASISQMRDAYATFWMDDDIQELQQATAAFLTDKYGDGSYVATPDDIADLQQATAAFLTDRSDGECFCLEDGGYGLLLPGEQFLLPASIAVECARAESSKRDDIVNLIDEYLYEQMAYEDAPHTPPRNAESTIAKFSNTDCVSFDNVFGSNIRVDAPPLDGSMTALAGIQQAFVNLEDISKLPDEYDRLLGIYNDADSEDNDDNGVDGAAGASHAMFDGANELFHSQALHAASFFDPITEASVPYRSLEGLLDMHDSTVKHNPLETDTRLSIIVEEDELSPAASDCSMDFGTLCGFVQPLIGRRESFLDNDISVSEVNSESYDEKTVEAFHEFFANDIWDNEPGLELDVPADSVGDAELELFDSLVAVLNIVQRRFLDRSLNWNTGVQHGFHELVAGFQRLLSPERLEEAIDLAVHDIMTAVENDSL